MMKTTIQLVELLAHDVEETDPLIETGKVRWFRSLRNLIKVGAAEWQQTYGKMPKGLLSFDINGLCTTLGDHRYDSRLAKVIECVAAQDFMVAISTANDFKSAVAYMRHIGVNPNLVSYWNCGNGKALYVVRNGDEICGHTMVRRDIRDEHTRMMQAVVRDVQALCERRKIRFEFVHPVDTFKPQPDDSASTVVVMMEDREDLCVNITFRLWDAVNRCYQPATEELKVFAKKLRKEILQRHGFLPTQKGIEVNLERNFIYIVGYSEELRDTYKAEYLMALSQALKDLFGEGFATAHAGDNHNEYFVHAAVDRIWIPADADMKLVQHLTEAGVPYDYRLHAVCPSAAVEYIHKALLVFTGEGLPADLWP